MTNEEKARELATKNYQQEKNGASSYTIAVVSALEMAEWKDQILKEYLEKLKKEEAGTGNVYLFNKIINELFGEEVKVNNSDNDE